MSNAGLHRTVPALPVRDVAAAVAYYRECFGFEPRHESDDTARASSARWTATAIC